MNNTIIDNAFIGSSQLQRMYQGSNLIWQYSQPDILLDYIGNAGFVLPFAPNVDTKIELKFELSDNSAGRIFGSVNNGYNGYQLSSNAADNKITYYAGPPETSKRAVGIVLSANTPYTVTCFQSASNATMVVNGTTYTSASVTNYSDLPNMVLGGRAVGTTQGFTGAQYLKYYCMKVWQANNLTHFYVPVLHNSIPCLFDKVAGTYLYNQTDLTPTYQSTNDIMLNYIQAGRPEDSSINNGVYYNTGIYTISNLRIDTKCASYLDSLTENYIIGVRDSGSSKFGLFLPHSGGNSAYQTPGRTIYNNVSYVKGDEYNLSAWYTGSSMNFFTNGTKTTTTYTATANTMTNQVTLFRPNNSNSWSGSKIYYAIMTSYESPARTYIPVLHNGLPVFYDMTNNTYNANNGNNTPLYDKLV